MAPFPAPARALFLSCLTAGGVAYSLHPSLKNGNMMLAQAATQRAAREDALLDADANPVSRVVGLLTTMEETLVSDASDDQDRYEKLAKWCKSNEKSKGASIKEGRSEIKQLKATIEELTAKSASLNSDIKETEASVKENRDDLAKAEALHDDEAAKSHNNDLQRTQNIQQLKNAIMILRKHHSSALPQLEVSLLQSEAYDKELSLGPEHEDRSLDAFMSRHGFNSLGGGDVADSIAPTAARSRSGHFLQQVESSEQSSAGLVQAFVGHARKASSNADQGSIWSASDVLAVRSALRMAASFAQAQDEGTYVPEYKARSGEIFGILQQMLETLEADAKEAEKADLYKIKNFEEMQAAKKEQIDSGEQLAEEKEDALSQTDINLVQAKKDLKETRQILVEDEKFLAKLGNTCREAGDNYEKRKKLRSDELEAVRETLKFLSTKKAKKAFEGTYKSFIQISSTSHHSKDRQRQAAAKILRHAAAKSGDDRGAKLAFLAASAQLDEFSEVKKAVNTLIATLKKQQADEVKKHDWCASELHANEMASLKENDNKKDLTATIAELKSKIDGLAEDIETAKRKISDLQVNLQKAAVNRMEDSREFLTTVSDQSVAVTVLKKAHERLAEFYKEKGLLQTEVSSTPEDATPPAQNEYKKNSAAGGVLVLLKKLILDAEDLVKESQKSENEAQAAYEETASETFESIADLQKVVQTKTQSKAKTEQESASAKQDKETSVKELGKLATVEQDLHGECDEVLGNFKVWQEAREKEVEALQEALSFLDGKLAM